MDADKDAEKRSAKICGRENYPADHATDCRKEICENLRGKKHSRRSRRKPQIDAEKRFAKICGEKKKHFPLIAQMDYR